jgi:hypothetical protein
MSICLLASILRRQPMLDILYLATGLGIFVLMVLYAGWAASA